MKITKRQLRSIIKETLDVNPEEWAAAQAKMDDILGSIADEEREDLSYEAINVLLSEPGWHQWRENKVDKNAIEIELHAADLDPIDVLEALRNRLQNELRGESRGPEGYHWSDAWVLMLAEELGLGPMWSNRETESQWADRKRKQAKAKVDKLMKTRMFSNAEPEDKAEAYKIIFDAIMSLEGYGGKRMWVEEFMADEWMMHKDLAEKLGKAAGQSGPGYWLDALVTWSNGGKDYLDWL
tara:strand:- start:833 stop:1549 length:717 start_codon:yes stop_codon:yes gene_type:complete